MDWSLAFYALGAAAVLAAIPVLRRALLPDSRIGRRTCPRCRYDMSATPGLRCSECGLAVPDERRLHRARPSRRATAIALLLLFLGPAVAAAPPVHRRGLVGALPRPVLVAIIAVGDTPDHLLLRCYARRHTPGPTPPALPNWQRRVLLAAAADAVSSPSPRARILSPWLVRDDPVLTISSAFFAQHVLNQAFTGFVPATDRDLRCLEDLLASGSPEAASHARNVCKAVGSRGIAPLVAALRRDPAGPSHMANAFALSCLGSAGIQALAALADDPEPALQVLPVHVCWGGYYPPLELVLATERLAHRAASLEVRALSLGTLAMLAHTNHELHEHAIEIAATDPIADVRVAACRAWLSYHPHRTDLAQRLRAIAADEPDASAKARMLALLDARDAAFRRLTPPRAEGPHAPAPAPPAASPEPPLAPNP